MIPKIENGSYNYRGNNICDISATLNIYDNDGITLISSTSLTSSYNISKEDYVSEIQRQLSEQLRSYLEKLEDLDAKRIALLPESTSFSDAVEIILNPIRNNIGG